MAHSPIIRERIADLLDQKGWRYTYDDDKEIFRLGFNIDSKLKETNLIVIPRNTNFSVYATININADSNCRMAVAEYLTRANYGLKVGNFELDMNDGEIRYKVTVDCGDDCECLPSLSVMENCVFFAVKMVKQYGDDLLAVMYGFKTPEQACKDADSKQ